MMKLKSFFFYGLLYVFHKNSLTIKALIIPIDYYMLYIYAMLWLSLISLGYILS